MTMKSKEKAAESRKSKSPAHGRTTRSRSRSKSPARTPVKSATDKPEPAVRLTRNSEAAAATPNALETVKRTRATRKSEEQAVTKNETPNKTAQVFESVSRSTRKIERVEYDTPSRQSVRLATKVLESSSLTPASVLTERKVHLSTVTTTHRREVGGEDVVEGNIKPPFKLRVFGGPVYCTSVAFIMAALSLLGALTCGGVAKSCTLTHLPVLPTSVSSIIDLTSLGVFLAWMTLQLVLAFIPIGPLRTGDSQQAVRCNGVFGLVVSMLLLGAAYYLKLPVYEIVSGHFFQLAVCSLLVALVVAIFGHVHSRHLQDDQLSPFGQTGWMASDFVMGRAISPRVGHLDLKMFSFTNMGLLGWFVLAVVTIVKAYTSDKLHGSFAVLSAFQFIHVLSFIILQPCLVNSLMFRHEGFGLLFTLHSFVWIPFVNTLQLRYLLNHPREMNCWVAGALSLLFVFGFFITVWSTYIKDKFRKNPYQPYFSSCRTVPTMSGKPLLSSSLWGIVRHPNYTGFFLLVVASSLTCGFDCPLTYFFPINFLLFFAQRASDDGALCEHKHGASAWKQYCQQVRSRLIPYVY